MSKSTEAIRGYGDDAARSYDDRSRLDKGDREAQRRQVIDIVERLRPGARRMIDLGAGTGFFAAALLDAFPDAELACIDGSAEMLAVAEANLRRIGRASFVQARLESVDWRRLGECDVVFSALAIHHLADPSKWELFRSVRAALAPGGLFVLIDQFRDQLSEGTALLEYLSCMDIRRRICRELGVEEDSPDLQIDTLIANDRRMRAWEGDQDALLADQLAQLRGAGFDLVVQFMQEGRYFGAVARTPRRRA